jgi:hypothetical protein
VGQRWGHDARPWLAQLARPPRWLLDALNAEAAKYRGGQRGRIAAVGDRLRRLRWADGGAAVVVTDNGAPAEDETLRSPLLGDAIAADDEATAARPARPAADAGRP